MEPSNFFAKGPTEISDVIESRGARDNDLFDLPAFKNAPPSHNGLSAMIVDDNPIILLTAAAMIKKLGYRISTAKEGGDALLQFQNANYDLLLTDFDMPVIDGFQLARLVKMKHPATKAIIMTGLCQAEVAAFFNRGCIDAWLFKPFGFAELKTTVMNLCSTHGVRTALRVPG